MCFFFSPLLYKVCGRFISCQTSSVTFIQPRIHKYMSKHIWSVIVPRCFRMIYKCSLCAENKAVSADRLSGQRDSRRKQTSFSMLSTV